MLSFSAQSMQWLQDPDNDVYHKAVEMTKKVPVAFLFLQSMVCWSIKLCDVTCMQNLCHSISRAAMVSCEALDICSLLVHFLCW